MSLPRFLFTRPEAPATAAAVLSPEPASVAANEPFATATTATPATQAPARGAGSSCSSSSETRPAAPDIGEALERACAGRDLTPAQLLSALTAEEIQHIGTEELPLPLLFAVADAVAASRARAEGRVPKGWTTVSVCAGCGPVYLWRDAPAAVQACPWCHERYRGRPVPRPRRVACATCSRFVPDPLGDGGIGLCDVDIPPSEPPRFPFAPRACASWSARET